VGIDAAGAVAALRSRDQCSEMLGIRVVDVALGEATVEMLVRADLCNGHRTCHGGIIFTLADTAMAFASNSHDVNALATAASIEFLAPVLEGQTIRATATERHLGGKTGIYDIVVDRDDGTTVALFRGRTLRVGGTVSS
jgi:acyl-CoA thioesterase